jgi:hypothetical protein
MRRRAGAALGGLLTLLAGCGGGDGGGAPGPAPAPPVVERSFDFSQGNGGWLSGYADYSPQTAPGDVVADIRTLPAGFAGAGYYLAGTNRSDDLFIYVKTRVGGLAGGRSYRVSAQVQFLSDVPTGCIGVGGSPGESVWVILAASTAEPLTVFNGSDYRVNLQRGNQGQGGSQGIVLGTIANDVPNCGARQWRTKQLASAEPAALGVVADERGDAWVLLGIDSGFEAFSRIYFQRLSLRFTPTQGGT